MYTYMQATRYVCVLNFQLGDPVCHGAGSGLNFVHELAYTWLYMLVIHTFSFACVLSAFLNRTIPAVCRAEDCAGRTAETNP